MDEQKLKTLEARELAKLERKRPKDREARIQQMQLEAVHERDYRPVVAVAKLAAVRRVVSESQSKAAQDMARIQARRLARMNATTANLTGGFREMIGGHRDDDSNTQSRLRMAARS